MMACKLQVVGIRSVPQEDTLKLTFNYGDKKFDFNRVKSEEVGRTFQRISLKLQSKKKKKKGNKIDGLLSSEAGDIRVSILDEGGIEINDESNEESFTKGKVLKINNISYKILINPPTVSQLSLPTSIMADFIVFPDVTLEFSDVKESKFYWYKSSLTNHESPKNIWNLVGEGFSYVPSISDILFYLKCVCIPGGTEESFKEEVISPEAISAGPGLCLFDQRQLYTQTFLGENEFRIVSYNILADVFADTDFARQELFPYCPSYVIKEKYRRQLIIKELLGYNADIICLQECQSKIYDNYLKPILQMNGYVGYLTLKLGEMPEGEALFYNTNKFDHVEDLSISVRDALYFECNVSLLSKLVEHSILLESVHKKNAVGQIHLLKDKTVKERFLVVLNTHLYYKRYSPRIRLIQIAVLVNYLQSILSEKSFNTSIIVCGDLNSLKEDALIWYLLGDTICSSHPVWYINEEDGSKVQNKNVFNEDLRSQIVLENKSGFPEFTVYVPHCKTTLDYIFSNDKIICTGFVPLPKASEIDPYVGLPCVVSPSDHLAVVLDMKWK